MSFRASMMKASASAPIASSSTRGVEKNRGGLVRMPRGKSDARRWAVSALESKSRYASGVVDASSSSSTAQSMTEKRRRNDVPTEVNDYRRIARKNRRNRDRLSVNKAIFDSRDEDKEASESNSNVMQQQSPGELLKSLGKKDIVDISQDSIGDEEDETNSEMTLITFGMVIVGILVCSVYFREPITESLFGYASYLDSLGPVKGPLLFAFGYFVLEMLGVPAFPLTMSAGALFGAYEGTLIVVSSATVAAVVAFLISRYVARDAMKKLATEKFGDQYRKIDEAIGDNGFGVVFMLRLSPLLPFSISNYLYGLTSVSVLEYAPASFLGMIPGTVAYVASGDVARTVSAGGGATVQQVGPALLALGLSVLSAGYIGRIASNALCEDGNEDFCDPGLMEASKDEAEK